MEAGQTSNAPSGGGNSSDFVCGFDLDFSGDMGCFTLLCFILTAGLGAQTLQVSSPLLPSPFSSPFFFPTAAAAADALHRAACILCPTTPYNNVTML